MRKAVNSVELISEADVIKQGDTANYFLVKLLDKEGNPVDVSASTVTWNLYNKKGRVIADRAVTKEPDTGVVRLTIGAEDSTGYGRFEAEITVVDGTTEIFPAAGGLDLTITANSQNLEETPVAYATISYFQESVTTSLENSDVALTKAYEANDKADSVQEQFNQVVIDGDSSVEAAQARVRDVDGETTTFNTLKERNDNTDSRVVGNEFDLENRGVNVENFSIIAPEVGEEGRIQRAIDYAFNNAIKNVISPPKTREIKGTITLKQGVSLIAFNNKFTNVSSHITFLQMEKGSKVYGLEIEGAGHSTLNSNGVGIKIVGLDSTNYIEDIIIQDVFIHDLGMYGIYTKFAKDVYVDKAKIKNVGYAGFLNLSPNNVNISNSIIRGITSDGTNGYGVAFTRDSFESLTQYPRAKDCLAFNVIVEDNPVWEGFDTHAGDNIKFENCTTRNCKVGIAMVGANLGGTVDYAPLNCQAIGNTIFGTGQGEGISLAGASGTAGSPKEYAEGCKVIGNSIYNGGVQGNSNSGGLYVVCTRGAVIQGNTLIRCYANGIILYNTNDGFSVQGNTLVDVQDTTFSLAPCVSVRSTYNSGVIDGNSLLRVDTTLNTYVSVTGIYMNGDASNNVSVGVNYNTCSTKMTGVRGQSADFGTFGGDAQLYAGVGTPEGAITAAPGSIYVNLNGGASTSLYIKETGTGSAGWVGK